MKTAQKWNNSLRLYTQLEIDEGCKTYCEDMDEMVVCPHCGMKLPFGYCYTSRQIHTEHGMGYAVCENCYYKEFMEEKP